MPCDLDGQSSFVRFAVPRALVDAGRVQRAIIGTEQDSTCECKGTIRVRVDGVSQIIPGRGDQSTVVVRTTVLRHIETAEEVERKIMEGDGGPEPKGILNA